jgi:hypothetical protein
MSRLLSAIAGVALVALLVIGCGGSESGEKEAGSGEPVISKARFIERAEDACAEILKQRNAAAAAWRKENPGSFAQGRLDAAFKEVVAPAIQEQVEALEALPLPAGDETRIDQMIEKLDKVGQEISRKGTGGTGAEEAFAYQEQAGSYGLATCARIY